MSRIPTTALVLLLGLSICGLSSCGKKDSAACSQVSSRFVELVRAELVKDGDPERLKVARANLPTLQSAILEACEDKKWSEGTRSCMLDAKTAAETSECDPTLQGPAANAPDAEHGSD